MSKMVIIEGNSNDKDNVRAYMVKGEKGEDGVSPAVEVTRNTGYATITVTDSEGTSSANIYDGDLTTADIYDNLTSTDTDKALSANQGKVLNDSKVNSSDIVDNLTSTATNKPLSANQGKTLKELLDGTVLYSDNTGTTGTVTLSEDISNMKRLRISGYQSQTGNIVYFSQDIEVVVNEKIGILFKGYIGAVYNYIITELVELSSTSITRGTQTEMGFSSSGVNVENTSIYITKVIGFDY